MGVRLPSMLKDAGLTALVAAALGIFIVGFNTLDVVDGKGLTFNYRFAVLAVAVIAVFFGRLGLSLAATGLRWPAFALGTVLGVIGAAPLRLPSTFLHWFVALAGVLIILRTIWPSASGAVIAAHRSPRGRVLGRAGANGFARFLLAPPPPF